MLIRRKCPLTWLAVVILVACIAFSSCIFHLSPPEGLPKGADLGNDYLLFHVSEVGEETFRISKSGDVEYVFFGESSIDKFSRGKLSKEDMDRLTKFVEDSGFFNLRDIYYPRYKYIDLGYDFFMVSIYRENGIKTVHKYVGAEAPGSFYDVLSYLRKEVEPKLQEETGYGTYIMAHIVNYPSDNEKVITEDDLKAHPLLEQAINNPGWFIYIGSLDDTDLEDFMTSSRNSFNVTFKDKQFRIGIYEWIKQGGLK